MQKGYNLNMIECDEFANIKSTQIKNSKVEQLCLKYYTQFKKHQLSIQSDKIMLYMKCAYFLAEKSQYITNMNGEKINNAALSLNDLLKMHSLEDVMITLKEYSKRITVEDPQTLDDLQKLIKEISFLITFYSKFQKVLFKLEMKDKNNQYTQMLCEFVWLLYMESKNKILSRSLELIDNTCMIAHIMCFALVFSWEYHQPAYFTKGQNNLTKISSRKQINARIHQRILEFYLVKNIEYYKNIAERFETYFSFLKSKNFFKMDQDKNNFLSPQYLYSNYKRLDHFYEKKLDFNFLDERIFFKDRNSNITPGGFTPFARQKIHIPNKKIGNLSNLSGLTDRTVQQGNYISHRILNYDALQTQIQQTSFIDVPPADIKFPKNIMQTPINTLPLIQQTPYTTGIMMYNYVNEVSSRSRKTFATRQTDLLIFEIIDQILKQAIKDENTKSLQIKRNQIFSVFKFVSEDYGAVYPNQVQSPQIMKAFLLVAIEVVFFVSNIDFSFDRLQEKFNLSYISIWRTVDHFLKFDKTMPVNIKVHLLDVEVDIISEKIWQDSQNIANIQRFLNNDKFSTKEIQLLYEKLCKRILHQIAFQIIQLSKNLFETREQQETISQLAFDIMKQVLLNHVEMIWKNHFDQIIMCTIFSICRAYKMNVKFQNIRETYLLCNAHLSDQKKVDMFMKISYEDENEQGEGNGNKSIVDFYNSCYLVVMNQWVKNKCQNFSPSGNNSSRPQTQRALQQKDVNVLLQSPISGILPKDVNYNVKKMSGANNGKMVPQMKNVTPRLHAYSESPLLKNDMVPVRNPINSRKAINFEETEKMLTANNNNSNINNNNINNPTTKKDPLKETCKLYQQNAQTSNFFNKKFTSAKPTKMGGVQTPLLIKSPCNGTMSPSNNRSPSARMMTNPLVKENSSNNYQNIYYTNSTQNPTKGGINLNLNR